MSIIDDITFQSHKPEETASLGRLLTDSLYATRTAIRLHGELGTGKTVFVQGLAEGLSIKEPVVSPTFALEQRYGEKLLHMDLYRLSAPDAIMMLRGSHEFPGIRAIEWPSRAPDSLADEPVIDIQMDPLSQSQRSIRIIFSDAAIPDDVQIAEWIKDVDVLPNIRAHVELVTECVMKSCDALLKRNIIVRPKAVRAAAMLHDLFRFLDFPADTTRKEPDVWKIYRERFGSNHERAAHDFLAEQGFPVIAQILRTHGAPRQDNDIPRTIEQKILAYCDKRALHDRLVSIDERFDDFLIRSTTSTPEFLEQWRVATKKIEKELFPENPPF